VKPQAGEISLSGPRNPCPLLACPCPGKPFSGVAAAPAHKAVRCIKKTGLPTHFPARPRIFLRCLLDATGSLSFTYRSAGCPGTGINSLTLKHYTLFIRQNQENNAQRFFQVILCLPLLSCGASPSEDRVRASRNIPRMHVVTILLQGISHEPVRTNISVAPLALLETQPGATEACHTTRIRVSVGTKTPQLAQHHPATIASTMNGADD
jgi:hypothetical protein